MMNGRTASISPTPLRKGSFKPAYLDHTTPLGAVRYAQDAHHVEVIPPRASIQERRSHRGGKRGQVVGFSDRSRRTLRNLANSIAWTSVPEGGVLFITLTYPDVYPSKSQVWRRHLRNFQRRLERRFGKHAVIWKLERQDRGAPHWHLVLLASEMPAGDLGSFRGWVAVAWAEVCANSEEAHGKVGTSVERWEDRRHLLGDAVRYLAKSSQQFLDEEKGELLAVGRLWGIWHADLLPLAWKVIALPEEVLHRFYRVLRRYLKRHSSGVVRKLTGRLAATTTERLLDWALAASRASSAAPRRQ